jgi:transposase
VVNQAGSVVREGVVDSEPEAIAAFVRSKAPGAVRVGLETGPRATWLWSELKQLGPPVICIDARHARAVLKMQINKSDRNDAAGIARIMQTGWFKEVRVKGLDSHSVRALLASRALLVKIKRDLENQIRGLLKNVGLVIGRAKFNVFAVRAEELIEDRPELIAVVGPLLKARQAIEQQTDDLDRKVLKLARHDAQVRRFMTVPGIGPITALCFKATVDDPTRFKRSRSVGAYVGLTTRRHASGEIDWTGRISKTLVRRPSLFASISRSGIRAIISANDGAKPSTRSNIAHVLGLDVLRVTLLSTGPDNNAATDPCSFG